MNDIDTALAGLVAALHSNDKNAGAQEIVTLVGGFLKNQQRIADSLEKLADCVRLANCHENSQFIIVNRGN